MGRGKVALDLQEIDLRDPIQTAAETVSQNCARKGQQLQLALPPMPLPVKGDPIRLTQVFSNLLDNACKYTPNGGCVQVVASHAGDAIVVSVVDNGAGIEASMVRPVFNMFWQLGEPGQECMGLRESGLT